MSVSAVAVIVVGYTYDEIKAVYDKWTLTVDAVERRFCEWKEDNNLIPFFPYYDAPYEDCLFGINVNTSEVYSYSILDIDNATVQRIIKNMTDKFGITPNVYLSLDIV